MNLLDIKLAGKLSRDILNPVEECVIRWHLQHNHIPHWKLGLGYVFTTQNFLAFLEARKTGKFTKPGRPRKRKHKSEVFETKAPGCTGFNIDVVLPKAEPMQVTLEP